MADWVRDNSYEISSQPIIKKKKMSRRVRKIQLLLNIHLQAKNYYYSILEV